MLHIVRRLGVICSAIFMAASISYAQEPAETGAYSPAQAAADVIREKTGADGAFLAAALVKSDGYQKDNLASVLQYPTDYVVIVSLTGSQIKQAFERSVTLYPQPNASFLQISGFEVSFNKNALPNSRVTAITVNGSKLDDGRTYTVAMPSSLQRGSLGYSRIWDKAKIVRSFEGTTLEDMLKGKAAVATSPRWLAQG